MTFDQRAVSEELEDSSWVFRRGKEYRYVFFPRTLAMKERRNTEQGSQWCACVCAHACACAEVHTCSMFSWWTNCKGQGPTYNWLSQYLSALRYNWPKIEQSTKNTGSGDIAPVLRLSAVHHFTWKTSQPLCSQVSYDSYRHVRINGIQGFLQFPDFIFHCGKSVPSTSALTEHTIFFKLTTLQ